MTPTTLPDGVCVPGPGLYACSMAHYHSQAICPGPSISSSGLRTIWNKSPLDFWDTWERNPDRRAPEPNDAFDFGRAAHALMLGDEVFHERYVIRPAEWGSWRTKDSQEWRDAMRAKGMTVITPEDIGHIGAMSEALQAKPGVSEMFSGHTEVSLIWEVDGIWLKARPDILPIHHALVGDLKTCSDAGLGPVTRDISRYGYAMQLALGADACMAVLGAPVDMGALVFVEKSPPYHVTMVELDDDALHWGRKANALALAKFRKCLEANDWPGKVEGIAKYTTPQHMIDRITQEAA